METQAISTAVFEDTRWDAERLKALAARVAGDHASASAPSITVRMPTTDEPIGSVPKLDEDDVDAAASQCRDAAAEWREWSAADRAEVLQEFAELTEDNRGELIDLVQLETGKARRHAFEEAIDVSLAAEYYAGVAPSTVATESRNAAMPLLSKATVEHDPYGIVGLITPWNNPLSLTSDAIPALAAGNGVLWKPDDKTPFLGLRIKELLEEAGVPEGVVTVVTGDGAEVGSALIDCADYVTFTGGTDTGRVVAEQAGRNLVDCSLELSGKNPMIVCEDANISEAVRGALTGCFTNAGQVCLTMERILVEESQFDSFLEQFVAATEGLELGATFDYGPDVGTLINQAQLERIESHVDDARERGATIHTGGDARPDIGPYFFEPTILTDVPKDSLPACEETFGPVVSVEPVSSMDEAIAIANDSTHGLNASVWSRDHQEAESIASQLDYGTVCINDPYGIGFATYDAPMGGFKDSGIGRRHGPEGVKKYTQSRTIATSRIGPLADPPFVPTSIAVRGLDLMSRVQRQLNRYLY